MGLCSIQGVVVNSSNYLIEYHIQRTASYIKPVMNQLKIQPAVTVSDSKFDIRLFSFYKKQQYINKQVHSFVLVPPGRACCSGLLQLPPKQCLLSIYALAKKGNGEILYCRLKKDVLISTFSDARIRIRHDFSIENLGWSEARSIRNDSKNSQCVFSLDNSFYMKLCQPAPPRKTPTTPAKKQIKQAQIRQFSESSSDLDDDCSIQQSLIEIAQQRNNSNQLIRKPTMTRQQIERQKFIGFVLGQLMD